MPSIKKWTVPAVNLDESIIRNGVIQWFLKFITKLSTLIYSDGLFHLFLWPSPLFGKGVIQLMCKIVAP